MIHGQMAFLSSHVSTEGNYLSSFSLDYCEIVSPLDIHSILIQCDVVTLPPSNIYKYRVFNKRKNQSEKGK